MDEQTQNIIREIIREEMNSQMAHIFQKSIQILDGRNIQIGYSEGTKIGTVGGSSGQKIGLYNTTPVVQAGTISNPTGGTTIDAEARTAINSILTALRNIGIIQS